ncbi:helix-turn-helix transcriptional regulator [Burkholderia stabilis]|uniref:helix-turn-helix transcriptional regulator n=2 Tax=Burkholderia cepacia complex TaxID=87882 RepID=UPI003132CF9A
MPVIARLISEGTMRAAKAVHRYLTPQEIEAELGERLKEFRVHRNQDQATLAARAGVSVRTLRNLESGSGSSLHTLILVARALGREQWFETIAPVPTINPLMLTRTAAPRQRASKPRVKKST